jgi:hypothetical protein
MVHPHCALEPRRVARPPLLFLRAALRSPSLDREPARGVPSWASPRHGARGAALLLEPLREGAGPCYRCTHPCALVRSRRPVARHLATEE